jgi:sRNA-binding regulator protein Hfq
MNRKLIRPNFPDVKNNERDGSFRKSDANDGYSKSVPPRPAHRPPASVPNTDGAGAALPPTKSKKAPPPVETSAEVFYYKKQIDTRTPMVIVLQDDEEIEGTIEWYDRQALKINCTEGPNLMLLKHNIKYMFKAEEREQDAGSNEK